MADTRLIKLRDVLAHGLRELAIRVAQVDLSEDDEPTEGEVSAWIGAVRDELEIAYRRNVRVPEDTAVYADPRLIAAAVKQTHQMMRLRTPSCEVLLAPPPPGYKLDSIAHEIDKAAQEATPTQELPTMDTLPAVALP